MHNANLEFKKIKSLNFLYEVNANGTIFRNVKSKKQSKIVLEIKESGKGYYYTWVHLKDKTRRVSIAKVVAECWLGDNPDGYEVDHKDRNSRNNDYRNLRYLTHSDNMKNRNHANIIANGTKNFENYRRSIMQQVKLTKPGIRVYFPSISDCAKFLAERYDNTFESMRYKLKKRRSHIYEYDVIFLNAETGHAHSTE